MKPLRFVALGVMALALPAAALAQSSSTQSLSSLMTQLATLEAQIQVLTGSAAASSPAPAPTSPASSPTSSAMCPDLSRTLSLGASGPDVGGLQTFLAQEGLFKAIATGYFGSLTEAAVARWQEENGIVSGGDANSTGLGVVGPKTRAAMEASCLPGSGSASSNTQCIPVSPPTTECPTSWKPITDASDCTTYYQCVVSLPTASASTASSSTTTCPVVQKPTCSGTVSPFQTDSNGCVISYQCSL